MAYLPAYWPVERFERRTSLGKANASESSKISRLLRRVSVLFEMSCSCYDINFWGVKVLSLQAQPFRVRVSKMQVTSGLKSFLSVSWVYKYFQKLVGAEYGRNWIATQYWRLQEGGKVIDIGCGPGDIVAYLPDNIEYVGFDISPEYIETAQKKWGHRATFVVGTPSEMKRQLDNRLCGANLVMCNGVLHHLDDQETLDVFELAKSILAPGGRFICLEPVHLVHESWLSKWVMNRDRGQHVRQEKQWKELASQVFENFSTSIATHLIRIPYNYIIFEYDKPK